MMLGERDAGDRTVLSREEILAVPGVLGDRLAAEIVAQLPASTPPAPWHSNVETALWGFAATPASAVALPDGLDPGLRFGAAAFIEYLDGAVGPYREVLATPRCVRVPGGRGLRGHVSFIAVDSVPSIHGGRANWALPKLPARFSGAPASDAALRGEGEDWSIAATVRQFGPWFPFRASGACLQPWPDGDGRGFNGDARTFSSRFRGRARLARFEVGVDGPPALVAVLPAGRHIGIVIRGRVEVGAPTLEELR